MKQIIDSITTFYNEYIMIIHIVLGAAIFLLCLFLRNKLSKGILSLLSKIIFKKNEEKGKTFYDSQLKPLSILFLFLGIFAAFYINIHSAIVLKTFKVAVIMIICWALVNYLTEGLSYYMKANSDDSNNSSLTAISFINNILKIIVVLFGIVMVISELGFNINGLITGIGIGGLAVSLAAQDAISNLISGFVIVFEKPFNVGDFVITDSVQGTVSKITMRSTTLKTLEDSIVTLPNSAVANNSIVNLSRIENRLIEFDIALVYSTSNELIEKCISDIKDYLNNNENILDSPIRVNFTKLDDSSLNISVFCYSKKADISEHLEVLNEVNLDVKKIIENNNVEFAFPSSSIYIEKN